MSGRVALRIPAPSRPQDPDAHLCTPWFARSGAAVLGSAPALLTFDDADFVERFLAGVGASSGGSTAGAFPALKPMRDWAEPPRATRDAAGASLLPPSVVRAAVDPAVAGGEGTSTAEEVLAAEESTSGEGWLRKLYLPTHRHFHLVSAELVCDRPDRPRVDPARIVACGAVVRRLVPDPSRERWEDWVPTEEGRGFWAELADASMRVELTPGRPTALDPTAPTLPATVDAAVRARLGLGPTDPLPALTTHRLNPLPPAQGAGHTARFGFVPVHSREVEVPPPDLPTTAAALRDEAVANLDAALVGPAASAEAEVRAAWDALLDTLWGPTAHGCWGPKPDPAAYTAARAAVMAAIPFDALVTPPTAADYAGPAARSALLDAMREEACDPRPAPSNPVPLPQPSWEGPATSVVTRWVNAWAPPGHVRTSLLAAGTLPLVGAWLRHLLVDVLADTRAAPLSAPVASHQGYRVRAAVLLWVRNLRVQLERSIRTAIASVIGPGDGLPAEARDVADPHAPGARVPLFTVASAAGEIEAYLVADEERATLPRPWPPVGLGTPAVDAWSAVHRAAFALEGRLAEVLRQGAGGGSGFDAALADRAAAVRAAFPAWRADGLDLDALPERGLLALDVLHLATAAPALSSEVASFYDAAGDAVEAELRARKDVIVPRYDPDHVYCVVVYARVRDRAGRDCVADRVLWSARTEPFALADTLDVLGLKPAPMRMPDLNQLLRDLPRIPRAGALPFAPVHTPPDSGYTTGEAPEDTARSWGIAWICSIGIPVFTICAWISFSLIFSLLLAIPGFAWMLLLKLCIPVPVPRRS